MYFRALCLPGKNHLVKKQHMATHHNQTLLHCSTLQPLESLLCCNAWMLLRDVHVHVHRPKLWCRVTHTRCVYILWSHINGSLQSLDWSSGMDRRTGLVDSFANLSLFPWRIYKCQKTVTFLNSEVCSRMRDTIVVILCNVYLKVHVHAYVY